MSSKLELAVLLLLAACAQACDPVAAEADLFTIGAAACSGEPPPREEVNQAIETWSELQRPAMAAAGLDARGQQVMSRRFALMALGGTDEVTCCDDHIGCFPTDVDQEACLAHLALLGCSEGNVPTCDENECWCSPTC